MANTAVVGVGPGIVIIAVVWILALVFMMMLVRAAGSAMLGVIPVFLLALTITLVLVFFPRSPETAAPFKEKEIMDTFFIFRYVLLAVSSLVFVVVLFMLIPLHFMEPVNAKALKTH